MENNQTPQNPSPAPQAPNTPPAPPSPAASTPPATPPTEPVQASIPEKKSGSKMPMIIIIILLLICLIAGGVIAYRMLLAPQASNTNDQSTAIQATEAPSPSPTMQVESPTAENEAIIENAIMTKSYDDLVPLMADSVQYEIEASEGIPAGAPEDIVQNLTYLNTATSPWVFDQNDPTILEVKMQNPDEYGPLFIGISANDMMVAFGYDEMNKINLIKVAASYKLLVN